MTYSRDDVRCRKVRDGAVLQPDVEAAIDALDVALQENCNWDSWPGEEPEQISLRFFVYWSL